MFRSFIYLDESRLNEYLRVLGRQLGKDPTKRVVEVKAEAGFGSMAKVGADIKPQGAAAGDDTAESRYDRFEDWLPQLDVDEYCDVTQEGREVKTLPLLALFRCFGTVDVPEEFDLLAAIQEFLPMLSGLGMSPGLDDDKGKLAQAFLANSNADIPIVISGQDVLISAKLHTSCFVDADYHSLEDLSLDEAFILGKVIAPVRSGSTTIFDPAKDFLRLNRAMRRNMKPTEGLIPVVVDQPVVKAEVIAIYH